MDVVIVKLDVGKLGPDKVKKLTSDAATTMKAACGDEVPVVVFPWRGDCEGHVTVEVLCLDG
jgi:hypothetical protein